MALVRLNVDISIPSFGGRPPLFSLGSEVKVTALHALVGGAIAAAIVWVAVGTPIPARREVEPAEPDTVVPARFSRAP